MPEVIVNTQPISAHGCAAHISLLGFLRDTAGLTGTKEGCASGDCGACTVILRDTDGGNAHNINSCITPIGAAIGRQVITVEGVGTPTLMHPVQKAMVAQHGSQCGFCTPGFVMSMVAAQLRMPAAELAGANQQQAREQAVEAISGNLCRCTGYRPIIDAALAANKSVAEGAQATLPTPTSSDPAAPNPTHKGLIYESPTYTRPTRLGELLVLLKDRGITRTLVHPESTSTSPLLLAGATDVFLEVTQRYLDPAAIVEISQVAELQEITRTENELTLGACVTHATAMDYFSVAQPGTEQLRCNAFVQVLKRFGSPQVRNRGTLGGNITNASPIADWPPLLIALGAEITLVDTDNQRRRMPLEQFFLGYKHTQLQANELLLSIHIPATENLQALVAHKISKRFEDDISSTLGAVYLLQTNGAISICRIAFGGVAAVPLRCTATEAVLQGNELTVTLIDQAVAVLGEEITPISDVRASADYRRRVSQAVLRNALRERLASEAQS